MSSILIVEDELVLARQLARSLAGHGHEVGQADSAGTALERVRSDSPDLVLLDLHLPDASGLEVMERIARHDATLPVILMTAHASVGDAVEAMRRGAADYLQKPLDLDELRLVVERVLERERQRRELHYHRRRGAPCAEMAGEAPQLQSLLAQVERLAQAKLAPGERPAILLSGETGTGKGRLARVIHDRLGGGAFIEVNCTALPETLMEAELFGHERGSFTDARTTRPGLFEAAEGGTLFLDEVGHASPSLQAKLLKAIEEKRVRRIGSSRERVIDVHVIAATNRDLDRAVAEGEFRRDLLHRLRVLSLELPPLRERGDDLLQLAAQFCAEVGRVYRREISLATDAAPVLRSYAWPGNVRELRNVIERAVLLEPSREIGAATLSGLLRPAAEPAAPGPLQLPEEGLKLAELERDLIRQALERAGGNRTRAARLLGISRDTLRYRLEKFGLDARPPAARSGERLH